MHRSGLTLIPSFAKSTNAGGIHAIRSSPNTKRSLFESESGLGQESLKLDGHDLAVVHALARFIAEHSPEHTEWCGTLGTIPFKRAMKREITYLEQTEMKALLAAPDQRTPQGQRDYALLLFLYNTGARADEAAQLTVGNLELAQTPTRDLSSVQIHGKGNKLRRCPLWPHTANALSRLLNERTQREHVFPQ